MKTFKKITGVAVATVAIMLVTAIAANADNSVSKTDVIEGDKGHKAEHYGIHCMQKHAKWNHEKDEGIARDKTDSDYKKHNGIKKDPSRHAAKHEARRHYQIESKTRDKKIAAEHARDKTDSDYKKHNGVKKDPSRHAAKVAKRGYRHHHGKHDCHKKQHGEFSQKTSRQDDVINHDKPIFPARSN